MANTQLEPVKAKPGFFYGYVIVICAFFIFFVAWGVYTTFGVFLKPLQDMFGWSNADISGAFSLSMIIYGVLGFVMGGLNDRFGPRIVMTISGVLLALGFFLMSLMNSLWQIYLFFGVIVGVGMSGTWVPQLSTIARWFTRRRALMTGIVLSAVGIGQLVGPPIITRAITSYDWKSTYMVMAGLILVVVVLGAQFMKRDPAENGYVSYGLEDAKKKATLSETRGFTLREAARTPQFYLSFMILFCYGFGSSSFLVHIVRHAIALDIPAVTAANILAINGLICIVGTNVLGGLGDKIGNKNVYFIGYTLLAITMFGLVWAKDIWMLYLLSCILGLSTGSGVVESPLVAWLFGLKNHGIIYGIIHIGFTAGAALGPFLMGYIFDLKGSYQPAFMVGGFVAIAGFLITIMLKPTSKMNKAAG